MRLELLQRQFQCILLPIDIDLIEICGLQECESVFTANFICLLVPVGARFQVDRMMIMINDEECNLPGAQFAVYC